VSPAPDRDRLSLAGSDVLVTGANGFVGPWLARALADRGARVHGLGLDGGPATPLASWHAADLADEAALERAVATVAPRAIVHLAGQSSAGRSFEQPLESFEINALGTWRLLEAARRAAPGARILVIGTGEVYGPQPAGSRVAESAPFEPVSPYALSKAAADAFAEVASRKHGLDVVRVRAFSHIGAGQRPSFVVPSWAQQIAAIERGAAAPVLRVGNLEVVRDISDVADVARAYVALLEAGRSGAAYNVCRGEGVALSDLARRLVALARVPVGIEPDPARMRPADVPYLVGDPAAIAADTGWRAEIPLDTTLERVLEDWRGRSG
jgi:GDP-4-dehydro-6-deoxy-D-mannose reductase